MTLKPMSKDKLEKYLRTRLEASQIGNLHMNPPQVGGIHYGTMALAEELINMMGIGMFDEDPPAGPPIKCRYGLTPCGARKED